MSDYTDLEREQRMSMLMESSSEVIQQYADMLVARLHDALDTESDYATIRFIQGQIAGIKDFCLFNKE